MSNVRVSPSVTIRPRSSAIVAAAITPWPDIAANPSASMNSRPACAPGETGSVSSAAHMSVCPRGSSTTARRSWSPWRRIESRFCAIVFPATRGAPSTIEAQRLAADVGVDRSDHLNHL